MEYPGEIAHGIMFHHCHSETHPKGQGSISQGDCEDILRFVGLRRILNPVEWLERLEEGRLTNEDICLTFDDALLCQFEIALPVLERYDLRAFWFVYSNVFKGQVAKFEVYRLFRCTYFENIDDFYEVFFAKVFNSEFRDRAKAVLKDTEIMHRISLFPFYSMSDVKFRLIRDRALGRCAYEEFMDTIMLEYGADVMALSKHLWMSNDHLRYLSDRGHMVGLHSYSHPMVLADLPYEEQLEEYRKNVLHIKRVCGREPVAMAHPANSYNDHTLDILKRLGVRCGFRANMCPRREGDPLNPNPYEIARQDHGSIMKMLDR